jgi:hypothetical protein
MSLQEGTIGAVIEYTVFEDDGVTPKNISSASQKTLVFRKPNKTVVQVPAAFKTDGTDGVLRYVTTQESELTPGGAYKVQADLIMPAFDGRTSPALFIVMKNL